MKVSFRIWSFVLLATASFASLAQQPGAVTQRQVFVIVNDYSGNTIATLLPSGNEKYLRRLSEDFDGLQAALPKMDLLGLIRENFCRQLAGTPADRCDQVTVTDRREAPGTVTVPVGAKSPLLVFLSIEYAVDPVFPDALKIVATYAVHGAHQELRSGIDRLKKSADPILQVWYSTGAPSEIAGSPIRVSKKPSDKELKKHAAARAYWLEGDPSRLESEIRRALSDVAAIGRLALPHADPDAPKDDFASWLAHIPKASALRDSGKLDCQKGGCNEYILGIDESRHWRMASQQLPLLVVSVPLPAAASP